MTKKHFERIAAILDFHASNPESDIEDVANDLADVYAEANGRFDRARFLEACGFSK